MVHPPMPMAPGAEGWQCGYGQLIRGIDENPGVLVGTMTISGFVYNVRASTVIRDGIVHYALRIFSPPPKALPAAGVSVAGGGGGLCDGQ